MSKTLVKSWKQAIDGWPPLGQISMLSWGPYGGLFRWEVRDIAGEWFFRGGWDRKSMQRAFEASQARGELGSVYLVNFDCDSGLTIEEAHIPSIEEVI